VHIRSVASCTAAAADTLGEDTDGVITLGSNDAGAGRLGGSDPDRTTVACASAVAADDLIEFDIATDAQAVGRAAAAVTAAAPDTLGEYAV
jgi:hypothetical protein